MVPEIRKNGGQFSRFWFFSRNGQRVLWLFGVEPPGNEVM